MRTSDISRSADTGAPVLQALGEAEQLCQQRGSRLTLLRRRVLEIIWTSRRPLGAYDILDILRGDGRRGAPPTVYRALDFLLEEGLIHRLASLNVFIGCPHPAENHCGQFLICTACGKVTELDSQVIEETVRIEATRCDFEVESQMVEILGCCPDCQPRTSRAGAGHS